MRKPMLVAFVICGLIAGSPSLSALASGKGDGDWWVSAYGALTSADHPLVSKAYEVFGRVLEAADKRANRYPRLITIRKEGDPWAISLEDGSVILTQNALEFCYRNVTEETGSARLAFIFGHELAHLAKDDFWHLAAFETMRRFGSGEKSVQDICELLLRTEDVGDTAHAREIRRKKELEADSYGMLYASMAGYDPKAIVGPNGQNFFAEWSNQITGKAAYTDEHHPTAEQRAAFLRSHMEAVKADLAIFDVGVRLYQLRNYEDSLAFFEFFKERFPCREVLNNIGLIHYQRAVNALAEHDRDGAYQYKLATILDTETRARRFRGGTVPGDVFRREINEAISSFKAACEKDTFYLPARVNLSSALIMEGSYSKAIGVLDEALAFKGDDPKVFVNRAIALYLFGPSINVDMFKQATDLLKYMIEKNPGLADARYNLGRLLIQRGRNSAAREAWIEYLSLEPDGIYAELVRTELGIKGEKEKGTSLCPFGERPAVKLGYLNEETRKRLASLSLHPLELGSISGAYYWGRDLKVLVLAGVVELVESHLNKEIRASELEKLCGKPYRVLPGLCGTTTLIYDHFGLDVKDGLARTVIYF